MMQIHNSHKLILSLSIITFLLIFIPLFVSAQQTYTFVEPLPGSLDTVSTANIFETYLSRVFTISIGVAGFLAVLMIVIGGVQYTTAYGNPGRMEEAKKRIKNAILGLLLVLAAWLILYTINRDLIDLSLVIPPVSSAGPPPIVIDTDTVTYYPGEFSARDDLEALGVTVNDKPPCPAYVDYRSIAGGCTSVGLLPDQTVDDLGDIQDACGCDVVITGGTEFGHDTHGPGQPVVDLRKNPEIDDYVQINCGCDYELTDDGFLYTFADGTKFLDEGDHWHVVFANNP